MPLPGLAARSLALHAQAPLLAARRPPCLLFVHVQEPALSAVAAGVAPVRHDAAKQQLAQLVEPGLSAANLALGEDGTTTLVSQGALPWLYATATQLANGAVGDWAKAAAAAAGRGGARAAAAAGGASLVQWCGELGVVLPSTVAA